MHETSLSLVYALAGSDLGEAEFAVYHVIRSVQHQTGIPASDQGPPGSILRIQIGINRFSGGLVCLEARSETDGFPRLQDKGSGSFQVGPDDIDTVDSFFRESPERLGIIRDINGDRTFRNVFKRVRLTQQGFIDGREDKARQFHGRLWSGSCSKADVSLSDSEGADHLDETVNLNLLDFLQFEGKPVDAYKRRDIRPYPVHQAGVGIVRNRSQHWKDERPFFCETTVRFHSPADDGRHHLSAHFDVVVIWKLCPGRIQLDASVRGKGPSRGGLDDQLDERQQN